MTLALHQLTPSDHLLQVLAYGFCIMIILHIYTAGSAVQLTQTHLATDIHQPSDLSGRTVTTWSNYVNTRAIGGVETTSHAWWVPMCDEQCLYQSAGWIPHYLCRQPSGSGDP